MVGFHSRWRKQIYLSLFSAVRHITVKVEESSSSSMEVKPTSEKCEEWKSLQEEKPLLMWGRLMSELDLISNAAATRQTPKEERGTGPEAATEQSTDVVTQVEWSSAPHSCSQEVGCDTPARRPGLSRLDWSPEREQSVGTSSLTHREPTPYSYSLPSSWKHNETQATVHSFWILLLLNIFKLVEQTTV